MARQGRASDRHIAHSRRCSRCRGVVRYREARHEAGFIEPALPLGRLFGIDMVRQSVADALLVEHGYVENCGEVHVLPGPVRRPAGSLGVSIRFSVRNRHNVPEDFFFGYISCSASSSPIRAREISAM